jgi:hypothetical protein
VPFFDAEDRETAAKLARKAVTALKKFGAPEMAVDVRDFTAWAKAMLRIGTLALWLVSPENCEAEAAIRTAYSLTGCSPKRPTWLRSTGSPETLSLWSEGKGPER